ncbi:hypothetical protein V1498_13635 [Peribacillus sp. SCS-26]|uniref:hypothetical protein n=1 Tax=Paraperibacillus marinus TaxID=3115295 RepID=UPI00390584EC
MAKSSARKAREKRIREGERNPMKSRGIWAVKPITRKTRTKQEQLIKSDRKHKKRNQPSYPGEVIPFFCGKGAELHVS